MTEPKCGLCFQISLACECGPSDADAYPPLVGDGLNRDRKRALDVIEANLADKVFMSAVRLLVEKAKSEYVEFD